MLESLLITLQACRKVCNFIKKRLQHSCFVVNIVIFLRTSTLKNFGERLLLECHMMRMMCGVKVIDSVSSDLLRETMAIFVVKIEYMLIHSR